MLKISMYLCSKLQLSFGKRGQPHVGETWIEPIETFPVTPGHIQKQERPRDELKLSQWNTELLNQKLDHMFIRLFGECPYIGSL